MCVYVYVCIYVCVYVYVYHVCVYIYIYINIFFYFIFFYYYLFKKNKLLFKKKSVKWPSTVILYASYNHGAYSGNLNGYSQHVLMPLREE